MERFGLFNREAVCAELHGENRARLTRLCLLERVESTNLELLRIPDPDRHGSVVLADRQTSGRGRYGKSWYSPGGANIYLSLGWTFEQAPKVLTSMPLAMSISLARALLRAGLPNPGVKWPNDLLVDGKKLAGILVEARRSGNGQVTTVVGLGVNVRMPDTPTARNEIDQDWTDVCSHVPGPADAGFRDRLSGMIIDEVFRGLAEFTSGGFRPFEPDWQKRDVLRGEAVCVSGPSGSACGRYAGISPGGGLLLHLDSNKGKTVQREYRAGEVSVRALPVGPVNRPA